MLHCIPDPGTIYDNVAAVVDANISDSSDNETIQQKRASNSTRAAKPKAKTINPNFSLSLDDSADLSMPLLSRATPYFIPSLPLLGTTDHECSALDHQIDISEHDPTYEDGDDDNNDDDDDDVDCKKSEDSDQDKDNVHDDESASEVVDGRDTVRVKDLSAKKMSKKRMKEFFEMPDEPETSDVPTSFLCMNLSRPIIKAINGLGFTSPTPIQARAIPFALMGKDIVACAVTGSGKTLAFMIPIIERLLFRSRATPMTRVLVLVPTRELAQQCHEVTCTLLAHSDITSALAVGGLSIKAQEAIMRRRPDIVIATPGRLIDFIKNLSGFSLDALEILVIDEADRILDDGFADELNEIVKHAPHTRQTMLFSATMTDDVDKLVRLSLVHPVRLFVDDPTVTARRLVQEFVRIRPQHEADRVGILLALCRRTYRRACIVFFRVKRCVHETALLFSKLGLRVSEIHGNLTQEQRNAALSSFRAGETDFLFATNVAARGLDIEGVRAVINCDMPSTHEQYLHRVGRTARAGRSGISVSLIGEGDRRIMREIMQYSRGSLDVVRKRTVPSEVIALCSKELAKLKDEIHNFMADEKDLKLIEETQRKLTKAENMIKHKDEIMARPKREWLSSSKNNAKSAKNDKKNSSFENDKRIISSSNKGRGDKNNNRRKREKDDKGNDSRNFCSKAGIKQFKRQARRRPYDL